MTVATATRWAALRLTASALALSAAVTATTLAYAGQRWVTPRRVRMTRPVAAAFEEVWFRSADEILLHGLYAHAADGGPTLVLCHGFWQSLAEVYDLGVQLHGLGYNVLMFDFRGCGRSSGRYTTVGQMETWDLTAALQYAKARAGEDAPLGVLGISMGASTAIMTAVRRPEIAALVADSPYASLEEAIDHRVRAFRLRPLMAFCYASVSMGERIAGMNIRALRPVDVVGQISPRPLLIIAGDNDGYLPPDHPRAVYEAAGDPKELWMVPDCGHANARNSCQDEYLQRVDQFFRRYLGAPAASV